MLFKGQSSYGWWAWDRRFMFGVWCVVFFLGLLYFALFLVERRKLGSGGEVWGYGGWARTAGVFCCPMLSSGQAPACWAGRMLGRWPLSLSSLGEDGAVPTPPEHHLLLAFPPSSMGRGQTQGWGVPWVRRDRGVQVLICARLHPPIHSFFPEQSPSLVELSATTSIASRGV